MSSQNSADDFDYLSEVIRSDIPDSTKLFFVELIVMAAFRDFFGVSRARWNTNAEDQAAIDVLEKAKFLHVRRLNQQIEYVAHRDCITANGGINES